MIKPRDGLSVVRLGRLPYSEGIGLQDRVRDAVESGLIGPALLLGEYEPTVTAGRRSAGSEMPMGRDWYVGRGIEVLDTDRGGRVPYHAPGQVVGYPVMRVDDAVGHVRAMERAIIRAMAGEGIDARSRSGEGSDYTGVWVQDRKIASIGVHLRRGISTHGFAVNVDMEMEPWDWIVPCGLQATMTSVALETGRETDTARLGATLAEAWAGEIGEQPENIDREGLERLLDGVAAGVA